MRGPGARVQHVIHGAHGGARGHAHNMPRAGRGEGIRVKHTARPAVSLIKVMCSAAWTRPILTSVAARGSSTAMPFFLNSAVTAHDLESLDTFGVTRRRRMIGEDRRGEEGQ